MDIEKLRTFIEVMSAGSFSGAAAIINISQSSISKHIRSLEDEFGVELFVRRNAKAFPTAAAELLCRYVEPLVDEYDNIRRYMHEYKTNTKIFTLCSTLPVANYGIQKIINTFASERPGIMPKVDEYERDGFRRLRAKTADILLFWSHEDLEINEEKILSYRFGTERRVVVVGDGHPLALLDVISINELEGYPMRQLESSRSNTAIIDLIKTSPDVQYYVNIPPIAESLSDNISFSILNKQAVSYFKFPWLRFIEIADETNIALYIACLAERSESKLIRDFREYFLQNYVR